MNAKRKKTPEGMSVVHPRAAGIDIGSRAHVVAVPPQSDPQPVRTFSTFTGDLHAMALWLESVGVTTIAMESTSVYWIAAFEILEAHGFEVILVNARDAKQVPGRKTDINDAQWLQKLHTYGLLRASFRPRPQIGGRVWDRHDALALREALHFVAVPGARQQNIGRQGAIVADSPLR